MSATNSYTITAEMEDDRWITNETGVSEGRSWQEAIHSWLNNILPHYETVEESPDEDGQSGVMKIIEVRHSWKDDRELAHAVITATII